MKTLHSLPELWQTYFLDSPQQKGVDGWCVVFAARDGNKLLVSLANPFTEESEEVFVQMVSDEDLHLFMRHYKYRFLEQLPSRFGFFRPEVNKVLTEYPDWQTFYRAWINNDPGLTQGNMPLLFDYPDEHEYRAMQLKSADYAGYRRLLVVLYQYRKKQFQKVFIQQVDDQAYAQIRQQMVNFYTHIMPQLVMSELAGV